MKKLFILGILGLGLALVSCRKHFDTPKPSTITTMDDMSVPTTFDWKTFKDVQITLTGYANGIVEVTSPKGAIYQKAFLSTGMPYTMKLTVPSYETSAKLNYMGQSITIEFGTQPINYVFNP
ncbi:MAG: hypothetical protein KGZ82_14400 [Bacteroidales bacterium]|nr:hypothetical protein [Bacteroidales bacterium]